MIWRRLSIVRSFISGNAKTFTSRMSNESGACACFVNQLCTLVYQRVDES